MTHRSLEGAASKLIEGIMPRKALTMSNTPTGTGQPGKIIPFPTKYKFEENARSAVARLAQGFCWLGTPDLYGPHGDALEFLADAVRISRGRP